LVVRYKSSITTFLWKRKIDFADLDFYGHFLPLR
jgi:hypothetical protein